MQSVKPEPMEPATALRLVLALSRATITPFTKADWQGYNGAMGDAHMVEFMPRDAEYLRQALGMGHWAHGYCDVILDDGGITWNGHSPVNAYAYQVCVKLDLDPFAYEPGQDVYWQVDKDRPYGGTLAQQIAALPADVRAMVMACPDAAQEHVVRGYLASQQPPAAAKGPRNARKDLRSGVVYLFKGDPASAAIAQDVGCTVGATEWMFCDAPANELPSYSESHYSLYEGLQQFNGCVINTQAASFTDYERNTFNTWAAAHGAQSNWTPPVERMPAAAPQPADWTVAQLDRRPAAWVDRANNQREA